MQVVKAVQQLAEAAGNLLSRHHSAHDNVEHVIGGVFHDFVKVLLFLDQVESLNDIGMMERGSNAEFSGDFFDIIFLCFMGKSLSELLDCKRLVLLLDESHGTASSFANIATYEKMRQLIYRVQGDEI